MGRIEIDLSGKTYAQAMREAEAAILVAALNAANCNKARAAEKIGLSYDNFRKKVGGLKLRTVVEAVA